MDKTASEINTEIKDLADSKDVVNEILKDTLKDQHKASKRKDITIWILIVMLCSSCLGGFFLLQYATNKHTEAMKELSETHEKILADFMSEYDFEYEIEQEINADGESHIIDSGNITVE